ncbi:hypothetical protein BU24DRAFT_470529 [Aaosphaeria arxii CBS 175.79]|uniref:Uncharacterized protein n=1 Tax=Aaosphaeria arxii CBS 175.79 TaxID=1450172 RepID=A0A6A5Y911_9PLEO|nr:uncharacterized protein BU24DRAFT_470529 [Aaosphaeria arxii CBS 175.79]KAF2021736.1 hypothetical protein BU24DRAFT_470529 [Aaosphaeria arxii CBS 175.79]
METMDNEHQRGATVHSLLSTLFDTFSSIDDLYKRLLMKINSFDNAHKEGPKNHKRSKSRSRSRKGLRKSSSSSETESGDPHPHADWRFRFRRNKSHRRWQADTYDDGKRGDLAHMYSIAIRAEYDQCFRRFGDKFAHGDCT